MLKPENLIIELDCTDSTNNYAMMLAEAGKAVHGMTITAKSQTSGKGQRGNAWNDEPGSNLLMSIILMPGRPLSSQFVFNCSVALAVINTISQFNLSANLAIKWPNDIIVNDKKAGGILIENVLRGSSWNYAIVGLGLNINQSRFPDSLPHATSLYLEAGRTFQISDIRDKVIQNLLNETNALHSEQVILSNYNMLLYRRELTQIFYDADNSIEATILHVNTDGTLSVLLQDGLVRNLRHGELLWKYGV